MQATTAIGQFFRNAAGRWWMLLFVLLVGLLLLPLMAVVGVALFPSENIWPHLLRHALPRQVSQTLILVALVGSLSLIIGTGCAWLVSCARFPLRRLFDALLLLPLAMPTYIIAFAMTDLLAFAGPVQTTLRQIFGWTTARDYWFPAPRSMGMAALVLSFALYPYVYLLARAAFREQAANIIDVARSLGLGPWRAFWRVSLPLARPALVVGVAMVMMEVLNDYGAVSHFAINTLTAGVFSIWLETGNIGGAAQLACVLLALVFGLLAIEQLARRRARFHRTGRSAKPVEPIVLRGWWAALAMFACALPVLGGFVLPSWVMLGHALSSVTPLQLRAFWAAFGTTLALALAAALLTTLVALFLVFAARQSRSQMAMMAGRLASLGYAAPGAVLAIGVMIPAVSLDALLGWLAALMGWGEVRLVLTGSVMVLIFAYVVRFATVAHGATEAALARIPPNTELAARALGAGPGRVLAEIHVPLIRRSMLTAAALVFVDTAKELPATLILRPFNFETLATQVYTHASLEDLGPAAPAALAIIALGLLPVLVLWADANRNAA